MSGLPDRRSPTRAPAPLSGAAVGDVVARYARDLDLPHHLATAHALRHTFCTRLAERGGGVEVIAELAGHADIRTARQYVDVTADRRQNAIHSAFPPRRAGLPDL